MNCVSLKSRVEDDDDSNVTKPLVPVATALDSRLSSNSRGSEMDGLVQLVSEEVAGKSRGRNGGVGLRFRNHKQKMDKRYARHYFVLLLREGTDRRARTRRDSFYIYVIAKPESDAHGESTPFSRINVEIDGECV